MCNHSGKLHNSKTWIIETFQGKIPFLNHHLGGFQPTVSVDVTCLNHHLCWISWVVPVPPSGHSGNDVFWGDPHTKNHNNPGGDFYWAGRNPMNIFSWIQESGSGSKLSCKISCASLKHSSPVERRICGQRPNKLEEYWHQRFAQPKFHYIYIYVFRCD